MGLSFQTFLSTRLHGMIFFLLKPFSWASSVQKPASCQLGFLGDSVELPLWFCLLIAQPPINTPSVQALSTAVRCHYKPGISCWICSVTEFSPSEHLPASETHKLPYSTEQQKERLQPSQEGLGLLGSPWFHGEVKPFHTVHYWAHVQQLREQNHRVCSSSAREAIRLTFGKYAPSLKRFVPIWASSLVPYQCQLSLSIQTTYSLLSTDRSLHYLLLPTGSKHANSQRNAIPNKRIK